MASYELKIALQYIKGGKGNKNNIISFSSAVSMIGIVLGVMALVLSLSLVNGFKENTIESVLKNLSPVSIYTNGYEGIKNHDKYVEALEKNSLVKKVYSKYIVNMSASVKEKQLFVYALADKNEDELIAGDFGFEMNRELAKDYDLKVGDQVLFTINMKEAQIVTALGNLPIQKKFTLKKLLDSDRYGMVRVHLEDIRRVTKDNDFTVINVELNDVWKSTIVTNEILKIAQENNEELTVSDWMKEKKSLLNLLRIEKTMTVVILSLIIMIATFNLTSIMTMNITQKKSEIGILQTMGCKPSSIMKIFMIKGIIIGLIGVFLGLILGVILSLNISEIVSFVDMNLGINYLIEVMQALKLKAVVEWSDVTIVVGVTFLLISISVIYPSWRASKIEPMEALRHE